MSRGPGQKSNEHWPVLLRKTGEIPNPRRVLFVQRTSGLNGSLTWLTDQGMSADAPVAKANQNMSFNAMGTADKTGRSRQSVVPW